VIKARSIPKTEAYDDSKVDAILHEIAGEDHTGTRKVGVPTLFGMNFQAISMGQKMAGAGYLDASGRPSAGLLHALQHTDQSLAKMINALERNHLYDSTLIIVTAKHGDAPIDPAKLKLADLALIPGIVNGVQAGLLLHAEQDGSIALLWLKDHQHTAEVTAALRAKQNQAGIAQVFAGESLRLLFNDPATDPRMPDIVIQPNLGVIYADSKDNFIAEHGGFTDDDIHVALLISQAGMPTAVCKSPVHTAQIAPTILDQLGISPTLLHAVVKEHTTTLPLL